MKPTYEQVGGSDHLFEACEFDTFEPWRFPCLAANGDSQPVQWAWKNTETPDFAREPARIGLLDVECPLQAVAGLPGGESRPAMISRAVTNTRSELDAAHGPTRFRRSSRASCRISTGGMDTGFGVFSGEGCGSRGLVDFMNTRVIDMDSSGTPRKHPSSLSCARFRI